MEKVRRSQDFILNQFLSRITFFPVCIGGPLLSSKDTGKVGISSFLISQAILIFRRIINLIQHREKLMTSH